MTKGSGVLCVHCGTVSFPDSSDLAGLRAWEATGRCLKCGNALDSKLSHAGLITALAKEVYLLRERVRELDERLDLAADALQFKPSRVASAMLQLGSDSCTVKILVPNDHFDGEGLDGKLTRACGKRTRTRWGTDPRLGWCEEHDGKVGRDPALHFGKEKHAL